MSGGFPQRKRTRKEFALLKARIGPQALGLPGSTAQPLAAVLWLEKREAWLTGVDNLGIDHAKPREDRRALGGTAEHEEDS